MSKLDVCLVYSRVNWTCVWFTRGEKSISERIHYFAARTNIPIFYQVHRGSIAYGDDKIRVMPFSRFCQELNMP